MEVVVHPYLEVKTVEMKQVRQFYDIDNIDKINEAVDAIVNWLKKEDHLAEASKYIDRNVIERIFVIGGGSVEVTKAKLDKCLTIRGLTPEICKGRTFEEVEKFSETLLYVPLPKLNPGDLSRVMIAQSIVTGWDNFNLTTLIRCMFLSGEYRAFVDYCVAERYVLDLKGVSISVLTKINPIILKKAEILATEGYGIKIKGIHILNAPTFVDRIVSILKQVLKPKLASRVHVHNTYEDLHQHISKEILPLDYGGDAPSCRKLNGPKMKTTTEKTSYKQVAAKQNKKPNNDNHLENKLDDIIKYFMNILMCVLYLKHILQISLICLCYAFHLINVREGSARKEVKELWLKVLNSEEGRKVIKSSEKFVTDESKRSEMKFNQEYLGMPGSFRKLATD